MDKFEYELKVEQIEKLIYRGDHTTAKKIADGMEWKKEKDTKLLRKVAELYVDAGENEKALYLLRLAYNSSPRGIMILERMISIALESGNIELAEEFCDAYEKAAPESSEYALYRYKLAVERQESAAELIKWLKDYTGKEMDEEYSYKLAELYEEIGDREKCIRQCDYIIDFFCFGEFVDKAAELKEKFADLDEYQMRRMSKRDIYEEEYNTYIQENDLRQKRQAREEAAEKQILEAQMMEMAEAELGEQVNEIFEEQERSKDEINLDGLVMEEMLQAEASVKAENDADSDFDEDFDEDEDLEDEDDDFFLDDEPKREGKGFWAGIKSKIKKQGVKSEEEAEFDKVKAELEDAFEETKNSFELDFENEADEEAEEDKPTEAVVESIEEPEEEVAEVAEVAEEAVEEQPKRAFDDLDFDDLDDIAEKKEQAEATEEPEVQAEDFENSFELNEALEDEDGFEDDVDEEDSAEKVAEKRIIRKREKAEAPERLELEAPEGSFMVSSLSIEDGVKYAIEMIRRMDKDIRFETIAKLTGRAVNKAKFSQLAEDYEQDVLMITGAGELTPSSADNLLRWMLQGDDNCIILIDSSQHLAELEHRSPKFMKQFRTQYDYQKMSSEQWIDMIEGLAKSENVVLDESAYVLFEKYLKEHEENDEIIVGQDLQDSLMDAIRRAERFSIGGLVSGFMATKYDEDGLLIIRDKHFV